MKYSPEIVQKICDNIKAMKGRVGACKAVGIEYGTFCDWMAKDSFNSAIKKAEDEFLESAKSVAIMSIFQAMAKNWQAAAWWLERNYPSIYALRNFHNVGDVHVTLSIPRPQQQPLTKAEVIPQIKQLTNNLRESTPQQVELQQDTPQPVVYNRYDTDDFIEVKTS